MRVRTFAVVVALVGGSLMLPGRADSAPQKLPGPHDAQAAAAAGKASYAAQSIAPQQVASDPNAAELQKQFVTYRVFATQYNPSTAGSVEVSVPDQCVKAAVLRLTNARCGSGYAANGDYRVLVVMDNGNSFTLPVKEAGPWNIDDNYWDLPSGPRPRRMFTDLPRGMPESQAAYQNGYNTRQNCTDLNQQPYNPPRNGGADQYGRCVLNASALDISIPAAQQYGFPGSSYVTATFLWEPSTALSKPAVFRDGTWYFRDVLATGTAQFSVQYGQKGDIPVFGDWNGDGTKTVGIFRPSEGRWYLRNSNTSGTADGVFGFGSPGDIPVVGDWNADGTDTFGVFRPSTGVWYLTNHFDSGVAENSFGFGSRGDIPVAGDWNQDGVDTIGVFRPSQGRWYLTNHFNSGVAEGTFNYGQPGDTPIVGDWDGDGGDTFGIVRNGTWYVTNVLASGGAQFTFGFGAATDVPRAWR